MTLTEASVPQIRAWTPEDRETPISVIPTCADVAAYAGGEPRPTGPMAVWNGSIGTWYDFGLAVRVARELGLGLKVLTREVELARAELGGYPADVKTVPHAQVPGELAPGDVGLCLVKPSFSKIASAPTRFAEHLAAGNPVVALAGVGDLGEIIGRERVGVVIDDDGDESVRAALAELEELLRDPQLSARCRGVAKSRFSLSSGVREYQRIYESLGPSEKLGGGRS